MTTLPPLPSPRRRPGSAGFSPADVIVALAVAIVVVLFVLMALPRSRESARLAACRRNLAQIGQGLLTYHGMTETLPHVGLALGVDAPVVDAPPSPHRAMLETLGVADFLGVDVLKKGARPAGGAAPVGGAVAGFLCPSDAAAFGKFRAPCSYRACAGTEFEGIDGPFAPGRPTTLAEVERRDGLAFTAAFAERLLGDGRDEPSRVNYGLVGSISESLAAEDWRGDAGSTWLPADFRYTLYTHAELPGAGSARVARDGRSSSVGAFSAHVAGVNVLMLDGSARSVTPGVATEVWRAMGSIGAEPAAAPRTEESSP